MSRYFGDKGAIWERYLKNTASNTDVNKIEALGLPPADLKGDYNSGTQEIEASLLGSIRKAAPDKKVAFKFGGDIAGLTYMADCFKGCTNLTQAPEIPDGVTNMFSCFEGCTGLTRAPIIPASVMDLIGCFSNCKKLKSVVLKCNYNSVKIENNIFAFSDTFKGCDGLTAGSIKVPNKELITYLANADKMGAQKEWFAAEY